MNFFHCFSDLGRDPLVARIGPMARPPHRFADARRRRTAYTQAQKERAVRLLNRGVPCRQVAAMVCFKNTIPKQKNTEPDWSILF